ncbi:MAG: hypothetical protein JW852_07990 [Spirochaetales bacterium]|nr:hypothetical protein [Spirochaetales bacterium]
MRNKALLPLQFALMLLAIPVILACTGEAPEIRQVFWQLNLAFDPRIDLKYETLSVFVHVADADGIEDVDLLYLLQDEHELLWELDAEGWRKFENGEETWIGSNNIRMNDGSVFPRALYRLVVIDRSGERTYDEFYINADEVDKSLNAFPKAVVSTDTITLEGNFPEFTFWFYDDQWTLVKIFTTNEKSIPVSSALNARERQVARYLYVNTLDDGGGYGFIYGPVSLQ